MIYSQFLINKRMNDTKTKTKKTGSKVGPCAFFGNAHDSLIMIATKTAQAAWFLNEPIQPCCKPYLLPWTTMVHFSVHDMNNELWSRYIRTVERRKSIVNTIEDTAVICDQKMRKFH